MIQHSIIVEHVGKQYRLGTSASYGRLSEVLQNGLCRLFPRANRAADVPKKRPFWALEDVSFCVDEGEVLGIIGRNGAGKSTLLKLLSRITRPTRGRIGVRGRVGSLLEVGTGFHPELTGRENVFLNGAILGMSRNEVRRKLDEIICFAGVDDFMETPVKHYSSGMYVRLAFSVAAHLETDVLIVDEVLSVGDVEFQRKCIGRMSEVASSGRTVLLVSHNLATVNQLCNRVLLLEHGRCLFHGSPEDATRKYLATSHMSSGEITWMDGAFRPGTDEVALVAVRILPEGMPAASAEVDIGRSVAIQIEFEVLSPGSYYPALWVKDSSGTQVFSALAAPGFNLNESPWFHQVLEPGRYLSTCQIPPNFLNDVTYSLTAVINRYPQEMLLAAEDAIVFQGHDTGATRGVLTNRIGGVVCPQLAWTTGPAHLPSDNVTE